MQTLIVRVIAFFSFFFFFLPEIIFFNRISPIALVITTIIKFQINSVFFFITNNLQNYWIDWSEWIGHLLLHFVEWSSKNKINL